MEQKFRLELFPQNASSIYLAKLIFFSTVLSLTFACVGVGVFEELNFDASAAPASDSVFLSAAVNFIGVAIYGMLLFILPLGLGATGFGYIIEEDPTRKTQFASIGFAAGGLLGFFLLFGLIILPSYSTTFASAGAGAFVGFLAGIFASSLSTIKWSGPKLQDAR